MYPGYATREGTARFRDRFPLESAAGFYRLAKGLHLSSLGLGTYLGGANEQTDRAYTEAVTEAVLGGINVLDAAINYRHQRSERSIGAALSRLLANRQIARDEVVVCTKAGFLTPGATDAAILAQAEVVGGMHSMAPDFLADQIDRSRENLGLETIDVFYLHNPETQLGAVPRAEFEGRIQRAFARLERLVTEHKIGFYGAATWNGFRLKETDREALGLTRLVRLAEQEGGKEHHFRFIQLPFNLGMVEAFVQRTESWDGDRLSVLETAQRSGVTVVASASLMQAKLAKGLPEGVVERLPGLATDAQRALQFTRSTPGITVALAGMSKAAHVAENLGISRVAPATSSEYARLYEQAG